MSFIETFHSWQPYSNMTKTIKCLNKSDPEAGPSTTQHETADESEDYGDIEDGCAMRINIHHMRCAVHTLQFAIKDGLKQPHYENSPYSFQASIAKSFVLDRKRKRPILDMTTRWVQHI